MWSLVMYSNCFEWNLSKEQTLIDLSATMLLLKVHLCLLLFITVSLDYNNDCIHGIIFAAPGF